MSTSDDLPLDERWSASFDGEADHEPRDADERTARDAAFADWAALGDELRAVDAPTDDVFAVLRHEALETASVEAARAAPDRVAPRRARGDRWRTVLGTAAAVVVAAGAIAVLAHGGGGDDGSRASLADRSTAAVVNDAGTTSTGSTGATGSSASGSGAKSAAGASGLAAPEAAAPRDLGAQPTLDALLAAFARPATTSPSSGAPVGSAAACGPVLATATLAGAPVQIVASVSTAGAAIVVDARTCAVLALVP